MLTLLRGRRAQVTVLGLAFTAMLASGPGQSFVVAVFVDEMLAGTGLSRTMFSVLYASGTVVSALAMLAVGRIADAYGLRALWIVVSVGLAGACLLASLAHGLVVAFLALAFLRTFGQGSFPLVATLLVARSFRGRRGQAIASATLGITVASVALPPAAVALILALGWRDAYRALALAVIVLVLPLAALVRRGSTAEQEGRSGPAGRGGHPRALRRRRPASRVELPTRRAWRLLFVVSAPPLLMTGVIFHAVAVLGERGLSLAQSSLALSLLGVASAVATVGAGAVSDRTRTRALLVGMNALLLAALLVLLLPSAAAAFAAYVLVGVGGGIFGIVAGIVWPRTYGLSQLGRIQGTASSAMIAGAAAGPLPLALSEGLTGGYRAGLVALAAYALAALAVAARWRDPRGVRARARPPVR